jgi:glutamyl-tRNA reductase
MSTCNRVEFIFTSNQLLDDEFLLNFFFMAFNPQWRETELMFAAQKASVYEGENAVEHLFRVASSIDSLVIGEREIITQVRAAFELCHKIGINRRFYSLAH